MRHFLVTYNMCSCIRQIAKKKKSSIYVITNYVCGVITMRKYRVLQLSLQLGFPITMDTCNSWYLYNLEC